VTKLKVMEKDITRVY